MRNGGVSETLSFRRVNCHGQPGHDPGLQRHHLLPRQVARFKSFAAMFSAIGHEQIGFDDFRRNGLLLPTSDQAAHRLGLPLHRGPHRAYNELVIERVGQIEGHWSRRSAAYPVSSHNEATMRLELLQKALRRGLLETRNRRFSLNRTEIHRRRPDFAELDAMAASLWPDLEP
jgi:hypothetical protein